MLRSLAAESVLHRRQIALRYDLDEVTAGFFHLVELPFRVATPGDHIDAGVLGGLDVAVLWRVARPDAPSEHEHTAVVVKFPRGLPESSLERHPHRHPDGPALRERGDLGWLDDDARAALEARPSWVRLDTAGDQLMLVETTGETGPDQAQVDQMFLAAFAVLGRPLALPAIQDPPADGGWVPFWVAHAALAVGVLAQGVGRLTG